MEREILNFSKFRVNRETLKNPIYYDLPLGTGRNGAGRYKVPKFSINPA